MAKKLLIILLCLCMVFSCAACAGTTDTESSAPESSSQTESKTESSGSGEDEPAEPSYQFTPILNGNPDGMEWKQDTSPVEMSVYLGLGNSQVWDWGADPVSAEITARTGVSLEYMFDETGDGTQLQLWMAADDPLPDFLQWIGYGSTVFDNLKTGGYIYDLNELFEQYAPVSKETLLVGTETFCTDEEGRLWMLNHNAFGLDQPTEKVLVAWGSNVARGDILKELGLELGDELGTSEELLDMLAQVKENHPDVKYPITLQLGLHWPFYASFGGVCAENGMYYDRSDDQVYYWWQDEEAGKDALRFANRLYREGYVNKEWFTLDDDQQKAALLQGDIFLYTHVNTYDHSVINSELYENSNHEKWYTVVGPMVEEGKEYKYAMSFLPFTGGGICISTDTADPARAIRFLSWTCSEEGQMLIFCGIEGKDYEVVYDDSIDLNVPQYIGEAKAALDTADWQDTLGIGKWFWHSTMPGFWQFLTMYGQKISRDTDTSNPVALNASEGTYVYPKNYYRTDLVECCAMGVSITADSDAGLIQSKISEYISDYMINVYLADSDAAFENAYAELISKVDEFDPNHVLRDEMSRQALERKAKLEESGIVWAD